MAGLAGLERLRPGLVGDPVCRESSSDLPPGAGLALSRLELVGESGEEGLGLLLLGAGVAVLLDRVLGFVAPGGHSHEEAVLAEVV